MIAGFDAAVGEVLLQTDGNEAAIISAIFVFLVSLIVGAVAIRLGAQTMIDRDTGFRRATVAALVGAIVYAAVGFFLGEIPVLGPLLMLVAWVGVINWQYPGGWGTAIGIGVVAWIVAVVILFGLATIGIVTPEALGVPGT